MKYSVIPTPNFVKEVKYLFKKYPSLKKYLLVCEKSLSENPTQGVNLGNNTYKIRLAISSKGKGKSGGARIITYVISSDNEIYLLSIYDKSEFETIDDKKLKRLVTDVQKK